jgi:polyisoprenoid-binding protein YceI
MKPLRIVGLVLALFVIAGAAFLGYIWFAGGAGEASAPAEARRVEVTPEPAASDSEPESDPDAEPEAAEPLPPQIYDAVANESEARFLIDEVLRGAANTVVGVTQDVDGSVAIRRDPAVVEFGEFVINVRTVRTDDEIRDRTIRTLILESNQDEYEFARFVPTAIAGVPARIEIGEPVALDLTGDLTLRDVTESVTFAMELTLVSAERARAEARTTVTWEQFDITIPYVGGNSIVASVSDEVRLELTLVADLIEGESP